MARHAGLFLTMVCAGIFITVDPGRADGQYWVAGSFVNASCEIVTSNPVINPLGPVQFATGPYRSEDDAKLARGTIPQCPKKDDPPKPG